MGVVVVTVMAAVVVVVVGTVVTVDIGHLEVPSPDVSTCRNNFGDIRQKP